MTTVVEFYISDKDRKKTIGLLENHFDKQIIKTIEQGFYNYTKQYCFNNNNYITMASAIYRDIVRNFLYNCDQNHRTIKQIKKNISENNFNPYNLAFLRPDELDEDNWIKIILRKNTTEEKFNNLPTITWRACRECKMTQYFFYQLQTRSADEPMTTFYICKQCGKTYKVNN